MMKRTADRLLATTITGRCWAPAPARCGSRRRPRRWAATSASAWRTRSGSGRAGSPSRTPSRSRTCARSSRASASRSPPRRGARDPLAQGRRQGRVLSFFLAPRSKERVARSEDQPGEGPLPCPSPDLAALGRPLPAKSGASVSDRARIDLPSRPAANRKWRRDRRWNRSTQSAFPCCSARCWCCSASCRAWSRCASAPRCCSPSWWSACWPANPAPAASCSTTSRLAYTVGSVALGLILFDGGLRTRLPDLPQRARRPPARCRPSASCSPPRSPRRPRSRRWA